MRRVNILVTYDTDSQHPTFLGTVAPADGVEYADLLRAWDRYHMGDPEAADGFLSFLADEGLITASRQNNETDFTFAW